MAFKMKNTAYYKKKFAESEMSSPYNKISNDDKNMEKFSKGVADMAADMASEGFQTGMKKDPDYYKKMGEEKAKEAYGETGKPATVEPKKEITPQTSKDSFKRAKQKPKRRYKESAMPKNSPMHIQPPKAKTPPPRTRAKGYGEKKFDAATESARKKV